MKIRNIVHTTCGKVNSFTSGDRLFWPISQKQICCMCGEEVTEETSRWETEEVKIARTAEVVMESNGG